MFCIYREHEKSQFEVARRELKELLTKVQQTQPSTSKTEEIKNLSENTSVSDHVVLEEEWEDFFKKARELPTPDGTTTEVWLNVQKGKLYFVKIYHEFIRYPCNFDLREFVITN